MKHKVKRYNEGELVGEAVGDSNEGMKEARDAYDASQAEEASKAKEAAEDMRERAKAEGARDAGKITESGDQGFGGAGSSRTVKATPKAPSKPKADPKPAAKTESAPAAKAASVDMTKLSANERTKQQIEKNLTSARSGSGATDSRDVNARLRDSGIGSSISNYFKNFKTPAQRKAQEQKASKGYASGGSVSSASKRADGIATKGKTRGKMV
jgi:hypothetical protein